MIHFHHFKIKDVDEDGFANHTTHHTYIFKTCRCGKYKVVTLNGHFKTALEEVDR